MGRPRKEDASEGVANQVADQFDLRPSDDEFDAMCDVLDEILDEATRVGEVCRALGDVELSDEVASAMLLFLLRGKFRPLLKRVARARSKRKRAPVEEDGFVEWSAKEASPASAGAPSGEGTLTEWFRAHVRADVTQRVGFLTAYEHYEDWTKRRGRAPLPVKEFRRQMRDLIGKTVQIDGVVCYEAALI